jgi:hypothetical protein
MVRWPARQQYPRDGGYVVLGSSPGTSGVRSKCPRDMDVQFVLLSVTRFRAAGRGSSMRQRDVRASMASLFRHHTRIARTQAVLIHLIVMSVVTTTSCQKTRTEPLAPAYRLSDSHFASSTDSACRLQSGISFQLQISTPRFAMYGERPVLASIGPDSAAQSVSGEYLMATRFGLSGLPNRGVYPTGSSGALPVTIAVYDTLHKGRQLALVRLDVPLKPEWLWFVSIRIQPDLTINGYEFFDPPIRYKALSLSNGDSLYVYIVGHSRKGPFLIR